MLYEISVDGKNYRVEIAREKEGRWLCKLDGKEIPLDAVLANSHALSLIIGTNSYEILREPTGTEARLWIQNTPYTVELRDPRSFRGRNRAAKDHDGPKKLTALMPGKVVRLLLSPGDEVEAGEGVLVLEAMKMQNEIKSPKKGSVQKILVAEGEAVKAGDVLAIVE